VQKRPIILLILLTVATPWGQWTQSAILRNPRTTRKRSKDVFFVTSMALNCGRVWPRLLEPLVQSLVGSSGTLESMNVSVTFIWTTWVTCSYETREILMNVIRDTDWLWIKVWRGWVSGITFTHSLLTLTRPLTRLDYTRVINECLVSHSLIHSLHWLRVSDTGHSYETFWMSRVNHVWSHMNVLSHVSYERR